MKKREQHILYIITKLELGGAQKVCLSLFKQLKNNVGTHLISGNQGPLVREVEHESDVYFLASMRREISLFSLFNEIKNFIKLVQLIKKVKQKHPALIVHTHSTKAGLLGRWAALFAGVKKRVHTVHGFAFHEHQNRFVWLCIYLCELITSLITTHFIVVSSYDAHVAEKLFPYFSKKYSIIRAAIDEQKFIPAHKTTFVSSNTLFIFGTIACFKKQKNLFDLLTAFKMVHEKNSQTHLEIIGDGTLRSSIEKWIHHHKLSAAITLHGWQHDVTPCLYTWDAFVLSSLWEGLPCAIIEARMAKLPVICYNTGGINDVIFNYKNGILCKQKDWNALAHAMLEIANNNELYTQLKTYQDDLQKFTINQMVNDHLELYKKLSK